MTEADMKRIEQVDRPIVISGRVGSLVAVCMLAMAVAGGWTAARVQGEVTASKVEDIRARMASNETKIDANTVAVTKMAVTIERMARWLDRQGVE